MTATNGFRQSYTGGGYYLELFRREQERYRAENAERLERVYLLDYEDKIAAVPDDARCRIEMVADRRRDLFATPFGKYFHDQGLAIEPLAAHIISRHEPDYSNIHEFMDKYIAYQIAVEHCRKEEEESESDGDDECSVPECRFSEEEQKQSGIKKHADIVLAVMDRMNERMNDEKKKSFWLCFYCVLLERGWIEKNLAVFCSNMNQLFELGLSKSSLNKAKKQYDINIERWPEEDDRLKEKKIFGLQFKAYLDFYMSYKVNMALAD